MVVNVTTCHDLVHAEVFKAVVYPSECSFASVSVVPVFAQQEVSNSHDSAFLSSALDGSAAASDVLSSGLERKRDEVLFTRRFETTFNCR